MLRADDLLDLHFEFINLRLETGAAGPALVRIDAGAAFVVVTFPPQHVGEEAFDETLGQPDQPPVLALLAAPTRLAFRVPDALQRIPFSIDSILAWGALSPSLAPGASASGAPAEPSATTTAIEAPFRLVLSPEPGAGWVNATQPVTSSAGWTELWHTRLTSRTVRVIWSPDLAGEAPTDLPPMSLSPQDRLDFVRLSSGPTAPVRADRLMLSSLGAWLDVVGAWEEPANLPVSVDDEALAHELREEWVEQQLGTPDPVVALETVVLRFAGQFDEAIQRAVVRVVYQLVERLGEEIALAAAELLAAIPPPEPVTREWRHRAAQGRDSYVRVTTPGFLFPLGHRATLVKITERDIQRAPDGVPTAYLRQRRFIVVQEPFRDYRPLAGAYLYDGRESPFVSARIVNQVTPALDPPASETHPFVPTIHGGDFPWSVVLEDREQRRLDVSMPLVFMRATDITLDPFDDQLARELYLRGDRQRVSAAGRKIAYATPRDGHAGETALATSQLVFDAQLAPQLDAGQLPAGQPRFLPMILSADVRIPAVDALLGPVAPTHATRIVYDRTYLESDFDTNLNRGQMFVRADAVPLAFPAERAGGVARPNVAVDGLSRVLGAVGDAEKIVHGDFDVSSFFPDAKILGFLSLKDLVAPLTSGFTPASVPDLTPFDPGELWDELRFGRLEMTVPAMTTRTIRDAMEVPTAVEVQHVWSPRLNLEQLPPELGFFKPKPDARLVLVTTLLTPLDNSEPTFESRGELSGFALSFANAVTVHIGRIGFTARSGRKLDVTAEGVDLEFTGDLAFVNSIVEYIPKDGFSDPPAISVTPEGISAGYSLGLPTIGVGVFSLENVGVSAELTLPFVDAPAGFRFALAERHDPFLVSVSLFGGGGFFALGVQAGGPLEVEASIEFGGNVALDLIVARGSVQVMAGIYLKLAGSEVELTGYLRAGGSLEVLGLITITAEFYMALTYASGKVSGEASLTVGVEVLFFSTSVTLRVRREFAGAAGDPTFDELVEPDDWATYCAAFA